jgi:hypothetical protein
VIHVIDDRVGTSADFAAAVAAASASIPDSAPCGRMKLTMFTVR